MGLTTTYDPDYAREWLLWKSESLSEDDLRLFIKILAYGMLNRDIYFLFQERIQADREKNIVNG